jgi:hypothetical protein
LCVTAAVVLVDGRKVATTATLLSYLGGLVWVVSESWRESSGCAAQLSALLILDVMVVLAIVLVRHVMTTLWARLSARRAEARQLQELAEESRATDEARRARTDRVIETARGVLHGIAIGADSPRDPAVRRHCAQTEATLRSLLATPPSLGVLAQTLWDLVLFADGRGYLIKIYTDVDEGTARLLPDDVFAKMGAHLRNTFVSLNSAEPVVLAVVNRGPELVVLFSAEASETWRQPAQSDNWQTHQVGSSVTMVGRWSVTP